MQDKQIALQIAAVSGPLKPLYGPARAGHATSLSCISCLSFYFDFIDANTEINADRDPSFGVSRWHPWQGIILNFLCPSPMSFKR